MFFQYNPNASVWGNMHWAHSSSPDMIHWKHEPVAIAPTANGWDRDGVFSGCIVLADDTPAAIYTGVLPPETPADATLKDGQHTWREVQCLAYSNDGELRTWQKLPDPIIASPPAGLTVTGFRDPCVWREGNEWRMALGSGFSGKGGAILLYRSHEGKRFTAEKEGVVDYGAYYAERSMLDRDGKRVLWGWIPERRPEAEHRAAGWAGVMSLPRVLSLAPDGQLEMLPDPVVEMLRGKWTSVRPEEPDAKKKWEAMRIHDLAAELNVDCASDRPFTLELQSDAGVRFAEVAYDPAATRRDLGINNTRAGVTTPKNQTLRLQLFVDASVLGLFAIRTTAVTERIYTAPQGSLHISISDLSPLRSLDLWPIQPISKNRLTN